MKTSSHFPLIDRRAACQIYDGQGLSENDSYQARISYHNLISLPYIL